MNTSKLFYENHVVNYSELKPQLYDLNRMADYGMITQSELVDQVAELTGLDHELVQANAIGEHSRNQPLLDYIQSLRPRYRVAMLSNISAGSMDVFFSRSERHSLFDAAVLSSEVGMIKPNPEIYQTTADRLGIATDECVMIDDVLDNCYGADAAGMRWIHFQDTPQCLVELRKLVD